MLGRGQVVGRYGAHARLTGQAGREPRRSPGGAKREAAAVDVEDGAAWVDVRDVVQDHGDATQVAGRRADVRRRGLRGERLLEERTLDGDVPAEIERCVAEDLFSHVALLGGHGCCLDRGGPGRVAPAAWQPRASLPERRGATVRRPPEDQRESGGYRADPDR